MPAPLQTKTYFSAAPETPGVPVVIALDNAVTAGSCLVVTSNCTADPVAVTITDTRSNAYTERENLGNGGGGSTHVATSGASSSGSDSVSFTVDTACFIAVGILEYAAGASPFDISTSTTGGASPANSGSASTGNANDVLLGVFGSSDSYTDFAAGSGFTRRIQLTNLGGSVRLAVEDRDVSSTGSYAADGTLTGGGAFAMILVAIKQASGPPPVLPPLSYTPQYQSLVAQ